MWRWVQAVHGGKLLSSESLKHYAGPGQGMLVGGDMYGFEIMYAGNQRSCMIVMSNTGSPRRMPQLRKLGTELTALATGRKPPKFTLGIELDVQDDGRVKILNVVPGGAAERHGLRSGDMLVSAGGKPLRNEPVAVLAALLASGEPIAFEIERGGRLQTVTVKPAPR
jgi:S1-C subfamily serine protease